MNSDDAKTMASAAQRKQFPDEDLLIDYRAMSAPQMIDACADNAHAWAMAFVQIMERRQDAAGKAVIDEATMIGWFANAIEAAWMKRAQYMRIEHANDIETMKKRMMALERHIKVLGSNGPKDYPIDG